MGIHDIERWLSAMDWPAGIRRFQVQRGLDSDGEPAVWVWVLMDDLFTDVHERLALRDRIFELVYTRDDLDVSWVYVRFREVEEIVP